MNLILQKLDHGLALTIYHLKCLDLALKLADPNTTVCDLLTSILHLLIPQVNYRLEGLSEVHQLHHPLTLKSLEAVEWEFFRV